MKGEGAFRRVASGVGDVFTSTWSLLSETTVFLSRIPDFAEYEPQLRRWRHLLQTRSGDPEMLKQVRGEVVVLRKSLRRRGYDVSLGSKDILCRGFRNERAVREGFRRLVIALTDGDIFYLAGEDNHINLWEGLEGRLRHMGKRSKEYHYLWYRRQGNALFLSGADTESKDDFERLQKIVEVKKLLFLDRLRNLF